MGDSEEDAWCVVYSMSVTMLSGVDMDQFMLAAYAGIASRNRAMGSFLPQSQHHTRINSIAAAYVATREVIYGSLAIEEVRAVIGPGYLLFLLLPVLFALSLRFLITKGPQPMPRNAWHLMLLGHAEDHVVPKESLVSMVEYPSCPETIRFGNIRSGGGGDDVTEHYGLGDTFAPSGGKVANQNATPAKVRPNPTNNQRANVSTQIP